MKPKCESCNSCGMPLEKAEDFALGDTTSVYCQYCVDKNGNLLPYETILEANASYFQESQGITSGAAIQMAENLLKSSRLGNKWSCDEGSFDKEGRFDPCSKFLTLGGRMRVTSGENKARKTKTYCGICKDWKSSIQNVAQIRFQIRVGFSILHEAMQRSIF